MEGGGGEGIEFAEVCDGDVSETWGREGGDEDFEGIVGKGGLRSHDAGGMVFEGGGRGSEEGTER